MPAFEAAIAAQKVELAAIVDCPDAPTFDNTIVALERTGLYLRRVSGVFYNLLSADNSERRQEIAREVAPRLASHGSDILLDERLFARIEAVWSDRASLALDAEEHMLLAESRQAFVRGGALLDDAAKERSRAIQEELAMLRLEFADRVLQSTNHFELVLDEADLDGLPAATRAAAAQEAAERGHDGRYVFTLQKPSWIPFLEHSSRRDLREKMVRGYAERGRSEQLDNRPTAERIAVLRAERAALLGYASHAHFVLEETMAETPEQVDELLRRLWTPALDRARAEAEDLQAALDADPDVADGATLEPWDWWYYAERVRRQKYDLDQEALKPYFSLDRVREGVFEVSRRLYGLRFEPLDDIPTYHDEVRVYDVADADGEHLGLFYTDDHPRASKRAGAWMNTFRDQYVGADGDDVRPLVSNVCNLPRPTADRPSLLSLDEVLTLFHEFGHALHGLLSRCRFRSLSGTRVPRDFVELPSQILENWALEPEVLAFYARHVDTGEPMPAELIERLERSRRFNQGFATVEYLAASFLDLAWHSVRAGDAVEADSLEGRALDEIGLMREILPRYHSTYFSHIFSSGYSAGYYSYIWAEVLDADAFEVFRSSDLFDQGLARSFRENVLERGHSEPPMTLYRRFRGAEPLIEPLLERRGLVSTPTPVAATAAR
ncbi:MAG: M3 family metallopeptidase [Acidobacteriota bacterium]